jgi:hypothetical protein
VFYLLFYYHVLFLKYYGIIRQLRQTSNHEQTQKHKNKKEKIQVQNHRLAISQVFAMSHQRLVEALMTFTEGHVR